MLMIWAKTFHVKTVLHLFLKYNTIQYEEISNTLPHRSPAFITDKQIAFTIPSCTYAVINFPVLVITSLAAVLTKYP